MRFEGISVRDYLTLKDREADPSRYLEMVGLAPELYLNRMMDRTLSGGKIVCSGAPGKVAEFYKSRKCIVCERNECVYV